MEHVRSNDTLSISHFRAGFTFVAIFHSGREGSMAVVMELRNSILDDVTGRDQAGPSTRSSLNKAF